MPRKNYGRVTIHPRPFSHQAIAALVAGFLLGCAFFGLLCFVPV
jgi:hypothetical protein